MYAYVKKLNIIYSVFTHMHIMKICALRGNLTYEYFYKYTRKYIKYSYNTVSICQLSLLCIC